MSPRRGQHIVSIVPTFRQSHATQIFYVSRQKLTGRNSLRHARLFSTTSLRRTDGVFRELTSMRVVTPWIDALNAKRAAERGENLRKEPGLEKAAREVELIQDEVMDRKLVPKRMSDSFTRVVLPLKGDRWLSDGYLNSEGNVRLGALFMDLDALSGVVAYRHTGPHVTTVTAAFDRISLTSQLETVCDLELSGQVTHVGKSSMEIALQVAKLEDVNGPPGDVLLSCSCTMVSLDPKTKKPIQINPLVIETDEEKKIYAEAERNSKKRKELRNKSLRKYTPDAEETKLIHSLWQRQVAWHDSTNSQTKPNNVTWMENTRLHTAAIMQPQYRNRHHFMIFGGFLLRTSYELAFCCAASFAHARPRFLSLDPSTFETPVPVGSVLYLAATVVYTNPEVEGGEEPQGPEASNDGKISRVLVRVDSYVRNVEHGDRKPTGTFNYSFEVDRDVRVVPKTYGEFMMYVDARRRLKILSGVEADVSGKTE